MFTALHAHRRIVSFAAAFALLLLLPAVCSAAVAAWSNHDTTMTSTPEASAHAHHDAPPAEQPASSSGDCGEHDCCLTAAKGAARVAGSSSQVWVAVLGSDATTGTSERSGVSYRPPCPPGDPVPPVAAPTPLRR